MDDASGTPNASLIRQFHAAYDELEERARLLTGLDGDPVQLRRLTQDLVTFQDRVNQV